MNLTISAKIEKRNNEKFKAFITNSRVGIGIGLLPSCFKIIFFFLFHSSVYIIDWTKGCPKTEKKKSSEWKEKHIDTRNCELNKTRLIFVYLCSLRFFIVFSCFVFFCSKVDFQSFVIDPLFFWTNTDNNTIFFFSYQRP